jgi:hypothetical protein
MHLQDLHARVRKISSPFPYGRAAAYRLIHSQTSSDKRLLGSLGTGFAETTRNKAKKEICGRIFGRLRVARRSMGSMFQFVLAVDECSRRSLVLVASSCVADQVKR